MARRCSSQKINLFYRITPTVRERCAASAAEGWKMRRGFVNSVLLALALLAVPCVSYAQYGAGKALPGNRNKPEAAKPAASSAPAPVHDLSGVWMMRNPPGSNRGFTNYTFTKDPPELTPWAEAKYKDAKASNGG